MNFMMGFGDLLICGFETTRCKKSF